MGFIKTNKGGNCMEAVSTLNLSHSSASQILGCEAKYWFRKVAKVSVDSDVVEADYLAYGKALHKILEDCYHIVPSIEYLDSVIDKVCDEFNVTSFEHKWGIYLSAIKYTAMHKNSGLRCVAPELVINNYGVNGFVDLILVDDKNKEFWISDLKTAAFSPEEKIKYLHRDPQLNLYTYFATHKPIIPEVLGIEDYKFAGCRYRVCTKSRHKQKINTILPERLEKESVAKFKDRIKGIPLETVEETPSEFMDRISDSIVVYDIAVPIQYMSPLETYTRHMGIRERAIELDNGAEPIRNYGNCMAYNKPCEYWSQCHGQNNSEEPLCSIVSKFL